MLKRVLFYHDSKILWVSIEKDVTYYTGLWEKTSEEYELMTFLKFAYRKLSSSKPHWIDSPESPAFKIWMSSLKNL